MRIVIEEVHVDTTPGETYTHRVEVGGQEGFAIGLVQALTMARDMAQQGNTLTALIEDARSSLGGDSNDAEHDSLYGICEALQNLTGDTRPIPEPEN